MMEENELIEQIICERGKLEKLFDLTKSFQNEDLIAKSKYIDKLIVNFLRQKAL